MVTDAFDIPSNDPDSPTTVVLVRGTAEPTITLAGLEIRTQIGICQNLTTEQVITTPLGGGTALPCELLGLSATAGDRIGVTMRGVGQSATDLSGRLFGMTVDRVKCGNETAGQSVNFEPATPAAVWNCIVGGLAVSPGDIVSMTARGEAL